MPEMQCQAEQDDYPARRTVMKKILQVVLDDVEIIELMRILIDEDDASALAFLKEHFKGKARELLEGG